jgi:transketolase
MNDQSKTKDDILELSRICLIIRRDIIEMIKIAGSGHPGGSLSATEILTCLYFHTMRIRPDQPDWIDRDRFILSKGHAAPALYAVLAERGFFPVEELKTFSAPGTRLQKHIDMQLVPGAELSTGSLAQGFSVAVGMALANRIDNRQSKVFVMIGDGESQEGQIWESGMAAAHQKLDNLIAFLDYNNCQVDGYVEDICSLEPIYQKWESFGWHVQDIDGHDLTQILSAIYETNKIKGKPHMIIARTIKGKAISFMENRPEWHARGLDEEEYRQALIDLDAIKPN